MAKGWSIDLREPDDVTGQRWGLSKKDHQRAILELIEKDFSYVVVLSPPCTIFSELQNLNPNKGNPDWMRQYNEGLEMLSFAMRVARK